MAQFNVNNWFKNRSELNIQPFDIDGVEFELMALSAGQKEAVKDCDSYNDMLSKAADYGLSYDRNRVSDDAELAKDIDKLWQLGELEEICDPCAKYRVGEKVCDISGLKGMLTEQLELEAMAAEEKAEAERLEALKDQGHINGDSETPNVNIDQLNDDEIEEQKVA